jgi:hypothetical protein
LGKEKNQVDPRTLVVLKVLFPWHRLNISERFGSLTCRFPQSIDSVSSLYRNERYDANYSCSHTVLDCPISLGCLESWCRNHCPHRPHTFSSSPCQVSCCFMLDETVSGCVTAMTEHF